MLMIPSMQSCLYLIIPMCAMFFSRSFQLHHVFNLDNENGAEDTPTLIDRKVHVIEFYFISCIITALEFLI